MHLPWRNILPNNSSRIPINTSLTTDEANELASLAQGKNVLEIGSAYGFSAVAMVLGGAESILAVDPHTWCPGSRLSMIGNLRAYDATSKVSIVVDTFFHVAPVLATQGTQFNFIFIDGDHSYNTVVFDAMNSLELLAPGGIVACHDYMERCCCPDVATALDEVFSGHPDKIVDSLAIYYHPKQGTREAEQ